jgi:hypothetical protein
MSFPAGANGQIMATAFFLILSGTLIGAGLSIIVHDIKRNRRPSFVLERGTAAPTPNVGLPLSSAAAPAITTPTPAAAEAPADGGPADRLWLRQQWAALQPAIAGGIERVNALIAPQQLAIGSAGAAALSYKNRGYGAYRRLQLRGDSIAWLRLELTQDGKLCVNLKAHGAARSEINASAEGPTEGLDVARAGDLLLACLRPTIASLAELADSPPLRPREPAWQDVDGTVGSALKASNGALAEAGARIVPLAPPAAASLLHGQRMELTVEVNGNDVARMHIERLPHALEVAVGVRDARLADLGRRRRLPLEGMTIHALAELITGCAWPAIARSRGARGP